MNLSLNPKPYMSNKIKIHKKIIIRGNFDRYNLYNPIPNFNDKKITVF